MQTAFYCYSYSGWEITLSSLLNGRFYSEWTKFCFLFTSKAVFIPFLVSNRRVCLKGKIVLAFAHWTFPFPCSFYPYFILFAICSHVLPKMWLTVFSSIWPLKRQGWRTDAIHKSQAGLSTGHRLWNRVSTQALSHYTQCIASLPNRVLSLA